MFYNIYALNVLFGFTLPYYLLDHPTNSSYINAFQHLLSLHIVLLPHDLNIY